MPSTTTAPSIPALPSRILDHAPVGEISTALVVHAGPGYATEAGAEFRVNSGRSGAAPREWSSHRFPFTAEGERLARAKFTALVSAAATVQA